VLTVIVTIMGRYMCSANIYCDNNGEVYKLLKLHIDLPVIPRITASTTYIPPRYCHYCQNNC
jgi:hypothetical protein